MPLTQKNKWKQNMRMEYASCITPQRAAKSPGLHCGLRWRWAVLFVELFG